MTTCFTFGVYCEQSPYGQGWECRSRCFFKRPCPLRETHLGPAGRGTTKDPGFRTEGMSRRNLTCLVFEERPLPTSSSTIKCGVFTGSPRLFVLLKFKQTAFEPIHNHSRSGDKKFQRLVVDRYVWTSMNFVIRHWAQFCLQCQHTKVTMHTLTPLLRFQRPNIRLDHVHRYCWSSSVLARIYILPNICGSIP